MPPSSLEQDPKLKNSSFLVFQKLEQDVAGFYSFTNKLSQQIAAEDNRYADADYLRSKLVGRLKNGNSLLFEHIVQDIDSLPNHYNFITPLPKMAVIPNKIIDYRVSDDSGSQCPFFAHTRKVNPRDAGTDKGGGPDTLCRRILRRGIPYGPVFHHGDIDHPDNSKERGLLFVSYQTSIIKQFEFLIKDWMNHPNNPEGGQGFDLLVGRKTNGTDTHRTANLLVNGQTFSLSFDREFITNKGGEYLYAPSLSFLQTFIEDSIFNRQS